MQSGIGRGDLGPVLSHRAVVGVASRIRCVVSAWLSPLRSCGCAVSLNPLRAWPTGHRDALPLLEATVVFQTRQEKVMVLV